MAPGTSRAARWSRQPLRHGYRRDHLHCRDCRVGLAEVGHVGFFARGVERPDLEPRHEVEEFLAGVQWAARRISVVNDGITQGGATLRDPFVAPRPALRGVGADEVRDEGAIHWVRMEMKFPRRRQVVRGEEVPASLVDAEDALAIHEGSLLRRLEKSRARPHGAGAVMTTGHLGHEGNERAKPSKKLEDMKLHRELVH